jgi:hypothetical protein
MDTHQFSEQIMMSINHAIDAHSNHPNTPDDAIRFWDRITPYAIHPIWCGMTLLTETSLPEDIRYNGYQALLWHDILEDTKLPLPAGTNAEVASLVLDMTFTSFREEQEKIWDCRDKVKLLKLYDKVSNNLDAVWMKYEKWNNLVDYTLKLRKFVVETYGDLNIVKIAGAVCQRR